MSGRVRGAGPHPAARNGAVIGIVLADDQTLVRAGFRMIIDAQPDMAVVGEAADGAEAVEAVRRARPQVALMDIRMPGMDADRGNPAARRRGVRSPDRDADDL